MSLFTTEHRKQLNEDGFTIVRNAVPAEMVAQAKAEIIAYLKGWDTRKLDAANPMQWSNASLPPGTMHGINRTNAHLQSHWNIRTYEPVARVFADCFGERSSENMLVSMDGWNFVSGTHPIGPGFWPHTDQGTRFSIDHPSLKMIQGQVVIEDCDGELDGGLVVWKKGHRAHTGYFVEKKLDVHKNWYRFSEEDMQTFETDARKWLSARDPEKRSETAVPMKRVRVGARAGDLILWDSRIPHQSDPPKTGGRDRIVMYVSMAPRSAATSRDIAVRERAWNERLMTSHWAGFGCVSLLHPRVYNKTQADRLKLHADDDAPNTVTLSDFGKRLLGVDMFSTQKKTATDTAAVVGIKRYLTTDSVLNARSLSAPATAPTKKGKH